VTDSGLPNCERCAGPTEYFGRISLPPKLIYRCKTCAHETWVPNDHAPPPLPASEQRDAQQQQQLQPDEEKNVGSVDMSEKADKFRRFAEEARKHAEKSVNEAEKERWIKIAEGWEQMAKDANLSGA